MAWSLAPSALVTRRFEEVNEGLHSLLYKYCLTALVFSNSQRCGQAVLTTLIFFSKRWTAYTNIPSLYVSHEPVCCYGRHRPTSALHISRIPHLPHPERIRRTADNRILTIMAPNCHLLWQDEPPLWQSQRRARYAIVGYAEHH